MRIPCTSPGAVRSGLASRSIESDRYRRANRDREWQLDSTPQSSGPIDTGICGLRVDYLKNVANYNPFGEV